MKKRILSMLTFIMMAAFLVACSGDNSNTSDEAATQESTSQDGAGAEATATDSVAILNDVWSTYGEDEKFYAMGGDMNNPVDNAPGLYSLADAEAIGATLLVPADTLGLIDEAASLIHGMNTNIFTGAAFHLADPADMQQFTESMKESILNNQWMCGSPDQYVIYSVNDEYVVTAFGAVDVMKTFKEKFTTVHGDNAEVLVEENVAQ